MRRALAAGPHRVGRSPGVISASARQLRMRAVVWAISSSRPIEKRISPSLRPAACAFCKRDLGRGAVPGCGKQRLEVAEADRQVADLVALHQRHQAIGGGMVAGVEVIIPPQPYPGFISRASSRVAGGWRVPGSAPCNRELRAGSPGTGRWLPCWRRRMCRLCRFFRMLAARVLSSTGPRSMLGPGVDVVEPGDELVRRDDAAGDAVAGAVDELGQAVHDDVRAEAQR
jgi:antitoxin (DNA-binding transcriptional repressor) of toxin-antitoxin stability system